jgi:subtilisin family serine protease
MRWRRLKYLLVGLPFCLLALLAPLMGSARQPVATFPVIVVFDHNAPLAHWRGLYRADDRAHADPEAWRYLDLDVAGRVQALEARHAFRADHVYSTVLRGFAARLTASQIEALENDPTVEYVEADGIVSVVAQTLPWGINRIDADISSAKAGNGTGAVSNVNVYIIDTGIDTAHADLNVVRHVDFSGPSGGGNKDCHGHGTHVSGTVAAKDNTADVVGVAPGAPLTGVKVLGCNGSGTTSGVIKGIDWVTANARKPAVANMSLGGGASSALDDAVRRSVNSGVFYSIAAGNSGADACKSSPARAGAGADNGIMTSAATDENDNDPSWSNFGPCVDIWAPGVNILSTRRGGGTTTMSGTPMAAPHVGGTAALYLSKNPGASPATVESALKANALLTGKTSNGGQAIMLIYAGSF